MCITSVFARSGIGLFEDSSSRDEAINRMSAIETLLKTWDLTSGEVPDHELVDQLLCGMSDLPYENLTKLLANGRQRNAEQVASDYLEHGTGGTCFSLVRLFLSLARKLDLDAQPILADRSYGPNTHCAAVVRTGSHRILADPGYLIHQPVRLDEEQRIELPHTTLRLSDNGNVFTVYPDGHEKFRYELHDETVSDEDFQDLWLSSFDWDMMDQLVINRLVGHTHLYLRDTYLHENRRNDHKQVELEAGELVNRIERMGIDRNIAEAAASKVGLTPDIRSSDD